MRHIPVTPSNSPFGDRMVAYTPSSTNSVPAKSINRISNLIQSKRPKICIVRGEGIGDVLMTTPSVHELHLLFSGNIDITYATNTTYLNGALPKTLLYNPEITKVVDRNTIDESDFDTVISLQCPAIGHEVPLAKPINRIDIFARHIGFKTVSDPTPKFFLKQEEVSAASEWIFRNGLFSKRLVMVHLAASSEHRSINDTKIRSVITRLSQSYGLKLIIIQHSSDKLSDLVWENVPGSIVVKDRDVRELAALMVHCDLLLCPDSAMLHVAGALKIPTVSLFGPTDPRARVNHYPNAVAIWGGEGLGGHPHWYEGCPFGNMCWKTITEEAILSACISQLNKFNKKNILGDLI